MKKFLIIIGLISIPVFAGASITFSPNLLPLSDNSQDLGSTTTSLVWKNVYTNGLIITGLTSQNCIGTDSSGVVQVGVCGGGGGAGSDFSFSQNSTGNFSLTPTTTYTGLLTTSSSTFSRLFSNFSTSTNATSTTLNVETLTVSSSTIGQLWVGVVNATSSASSSLNKFTFNQGQGTGFSVTNLSVTNAPTFSALTGVLKGNGSSPLTVAANGTDFTLITAVTCSGTDKVSAITADGTITCSTDVTGSGGASSDFSYVVNSTDSRHLTPTSTLVGLFVPSASSTFNLLTSRYSTSTEATTSVLSVSGHTMLNTLNVSGAATLPGGVTITCTSCITDTNVADLAVGGDVTGTLSAIAVTDNSHLHDSTSISGIDISADTNLTGGVGLTLTGDDMACDTATSGVFGCLT